MCISTFIYIYTHTVHTYIFTISIFKHSVLIAHTTAKCRSASREVPVREPSFGPAVFSLCRQCVMFWGL